MPTILLTIATLCGTPSGYNTDREVIACQQYYIKCIGLDGANAHVPNSDLKTAELARCVVKKQRLGGDK